MAQEMDVVVIGSGPGGYVAAIRAAQLKQKVALVERENRLGGICLNWGCIPTKSLLKNAEIYHLLKHRTDEFGIKVSGLEFDFSKVIARSRGAAEKMSNGVQYLMKKYQVAVHTGNGRMADKNTVEVLDRSGKTLETLRTKATIIATGARPRQIPGIPVDGKRVITSTEAMSLKDFPKSMVIIGAGAIGVEFAYFYHTFGCKVTLIEMLPTLLPVEDLEISTLLTRSFTKAGIEVMVNTKVEEVKATDRGVSVRVNSEGKTSQIEADLALNAVGVVGNSENLGLEKFGVKIEKSWIKVDEHCRTSVSSVYAIGDVAGPPWLAHKASAEGVIAAETIAGLKVAGLERDLIPGCTYCQPQVASVGLTEEQVKEKGIKYKVGKFPFTASGKAVGIGETYGMVKLIFEEKYGELLGGHIIGSEATEMIAELGLAKTCEATYHEIHRTIHAHPTLSEAIMDAAGVAFGESVNL